MRMNTEMSVLEAYIESSYKIIVQIAYLCYDIPQKNPGDLLYYR